ncbi:glutamyl-tRNA reductase [Anaerovorax odorimutans]|uniref:Glutamyl-tRNA reductase n=1 Tax=Anaerovorax odorimutans TaxID=109327 RepID=A0ABT1RMI0_9FIRM|nr:glutamyl-tRNA reductase [Anaerovorax odorimutans]MCQ4636377.1 glutamyl-tRNA reductase [Anaerovorax odorimutans]
MDIRMIGIDHQNASIRQREALAFTKSQARRALCQWKAEGAFSGGLLLSTCNRTELWVSGSEADLGKLLCDTKGLNQDHYAQLFILRSGEEAVLHLLQLICGLKSRIYGEDQILSQVREALEAARDCKTDDTVIEKLFQTAISAGKRVKTQVRIETADPSAARNAVLLLKEKLGGLEGVPCLVIGNGQMGKLAANALTDSGAQVTMTLRKKMHGQEAQESIIPEGCEMIDYEERLDGLERYRAVISATLSPHFTIRKDQIEGKRFLPSLWIDMAVPRDIDPAAADLQGIELYDMDRLGDSYSGKRNEASLRKAMEILEEYKKELERWFSFRQHVDTVKHLSAVTAEDACKRMEKLSAEEAVDHAVEKLLFGLRDTLPEELWESCLSALTESARRDTLKTGKARWEK